MPEDKRKFSRIPVKFDVELTAGDRTFRAGEFVNLGLGGCLLPITADLKPGTVCRLCVILNATENEIIIEIDGAVKRSDSGTVAVQFTRIDPDSLFHLQNIVRYNFPDADVIDREISKHPGIR